MLAMEKRQCIFRHLPLNLQDTLRLWVAAVSGVTAWEGKFSEQNSIWALHRIGWPFTV